MHDKMPCSALAHQRGITLITFACAVTIESTGAQKDTFLYNNDIISLLIDKVGTEWYQIL